MDNLECRSTRSMPFHNNTASADSGYKAQVKMTLHDVSTHSGNGKTAMQIKAVVEVSQSSEDPLINECCLAEREVTAMAKENQRLSNDFFDKLEMEQQAAEIRRLASNSRHKDPDIELSYWCHGLRPLLFKSNHSTHEGLNVISEKGVSEKAMDGTVSTSAVSTDSGNTQNAGEIPSLDSSRAELEPQKVGKKEPSPIGESSARIGVDVSGLNSNTIMQTEDETPSHDQSPEVNQPFQLSEHEVDLLPVWAGGLFSLLLDLDREAGDTDLCNEINTALEQGVDTESIMEVITIADQQTGMPFFFDKMLNAAKGNNLKVINNYLKGIAGSQLDSDAIIRAFECEFLSVKDRRNHQVKVPAFYVLMERDDSGTAVALFMETVFDLLDGNKIDKKQLIDMLLAEDSQGRTSFFKAMGRGKVKNIAVYCEMISKRSQTSNLSESDIVKLLHSRKEKKQVDALSMAVTGNHKDSVSVFLEAIKEFPGVSFDSKEKLITFLNPSSKHAAFIGKHHKKFDLGLIAYRTGLESFKVRTDLSASREATDDAGLINEKINKLLKEFDACFDKKWKHLFAVKERFFK